MRKLVFAAAAAACASMAFAEYEAKWESLDSRPVPQWWQDAKFGIFIHWGPYAVPAFGNITKDGKFAWDCYAEWYQGFMLKGKKPYLEHHEKFYHNAPYGNFAAQFKAEHFDPAEWARLFKQAGAKYVVLTSKHHDGYALWPSPESPYYNAVAMGSGRDLAGEFCKAMREAGLKRGFYFSMLEYANPLYPGIRDGQPSPTALTPEEWNRRVNLPQLKELAENYEADIIWPDGEWDYPSDRHCSKEYLAWLFNESKVKDTVVVNDRWGKECRGHHGGHYTTEYVLEGGDASGDSAAPVRQTPRRVRVPERVEVRVPRQPDLVAQGGEPARDGGRAHPGDHAGPPARDRPLARRERRGDLRVGEVGRGAEGPQGRLLHPQGERPLPYLLRPRPHADHGEDGRGEVGRRPRRAGGQGGVVGEGRRPYRRPASVRRRRVLVRVRSSPQDCTLTAGC